MGHWRQVRIQNTMIRTPEEKRTRGWHVTQDTRQTNRDPEIRTKLQCLLLNKETPIFSNHLILMKVNRT